MNKRDYPNGGNNRQSDKGQFYPEWYDSEGHNKIRTTITNFYRTKSAAKHAKQVDSKPVTESTTKKTLETPDARSNETYIVHNVKEYLAAVDDCYTVLWGKNGEAESPLKCKPKLWFRGLKSEDYPLVPTLARKPFNIEQEKIFISKFKAKTVPNFGEPALFSFSSSLPVESYWKMLFTMQNFGIPTRLMDWTEDAFIALLFATDSNIAESEAEKNPVVWCLNPVKLNETYKFNESFSSVYIPSPDEPKVSLLFGPQGNPCLNKKPCALNSPFNSPQLTVQKGVFTVFPYSAELTAFEKVPDSAEFLSKIVISGELRCELSEQLRRYGLTRAAILPHLASLATEIREDGL